MNKAALAEAVAEKVGISKKEAEEMLSSMVMIIMHTLSQGGTVNIAGFGQFTAKTRAGRVGVNPQNPTEKINIPPVTVPKFKAGKALKDILKAKSASPTAPTAPAAPTILQTTPPPTMM